MKKNYLLFFMLSTITISAQKTYQQYKREKEYEQKYHNEQRQTLNKNIDKALIEYGKAMNKYEELVLLYKSVNYVEEKYSYVTDYLKNMRVQLNSVLEYMSMIQQQKYRDISHIGNVLDDNYYK